MGDGIREETESLTAHLQSHAGIHFALALVELALFRLPGKSVLVQPRMIARTVNIERGIIRFYDPRISIEPVPAEGRNDPGPKTLTEEEFYDQIAKRDPALRVRLRSFLQRLEPIRVTAEFRRSLILRWRAPDDTELNFGYISTDGRTRTDAVNWRGRELGILDITHDYVRDVAEAIHGEAKAMSEYGDHLYVTRNGHEPVIDEMLEHEDAWVRAIERLGQRVTERLERRAE